MPRKNIFRRFTSEGGYRDILTIAIPLIFTTGSWALQNFIDRMFLNWYSTEAMAASMPAGMLNFTLVSLFMGTVELCEHLCGAVLRLGPE